MNTTVIFRGVSGIVAVLLLATVAEAWSPVAVDEDPLLRMPGTQPNEVSLEEAESCSMCHAVSEAPTDLMFNWQGSMMGQAARDPIYLATMTVAGQDSIWALGTPNAMDLCLRCHFPKGWLEGRSDPPNAEIMTGSDYDGVDCAFCHGLYDPFFVDSHSGARESDDWEGYWDETNASETPAKEAAESSYALNQARAQKVRLFNGNAFFDKEGRPFSKDYTENAGGQFFMTGSDAQAGPYADAEEMHDIEYSRYTKSKFFCATCHDVSNPVLANLELAKTQGGDGATILPSEKLSAHRYGHVERTFSEFMLSAYAQQGGAAGLGAFAPKNFDTPLTNNFVATCQHCHLPATQITDSDQLIGRARPEESSEHPKSAFKVHDLSGGNMWVPYLLASSVADSPNYDATNAALLSQGPEILTLEMDGGMGLNSNALLASVQRAAKNLRRAAAIEEVHFDPEQGSLRFRVQNQTGHKLISGYPEGRRIFLNIQAFQQDQCVYEVNPYDTTVGTLKGLPADYSPESTPLGATERHLDALVYEAQLSSTLTGEEKTFHFALATGRFKDNRIPPKGFAIAEAATRLVDPVYNGKSAPDYFSAEEYAGGYDAITLSLPVTADKVVISLYYQTTSREYMAFLRDEINGKASTLSSPTHSGEAQAYIIQTDPFFAQLKAWGDTIWQLWEHNKDVPGAAPVLMAREVIHITE